MKTSCKLPLASALLTLAVASFCALPGDASTIFLNPIADAFVATGPNPPAALSDENFGGAGSLAIAASGLAKGEFQSVLMFDLSSAKQSFDTQFGVGQWTIQSVLLELTATANNNATFNTTAAGHFGVSLMQNNSWAEGTGNPSTPTTDGITFNTLQSTFINNTLDEALGIFNFTGNSSGSNIYALSLTSGLTSDLQNGTDASLRAFATDPTTSYLVNSRSGGSATSHPELIITVIPEPGAAGLGVTALATFATWRYVGRRKRSGPLPG